MALNNPYRIDVENQRVKGNGMDWGIEEINDKLPAGVEFEKFKKGCDCKKIGKWIEGTDEHPPMREQPEFDPQLIDRGDKWGLKICKNCGGLWGWHDIRADYM